MTIFNLGVKSLGLVADKSRVSSAKTDEALAATPRQRFEQLENQITSAFSLPLTFYDVDTGNLNGDESFGVTHQRVDSAFAAYMEWNALAIRHGWIVEAPAPQA